jgi:hypothetical protein
MPRRPLRTELLLTALLFSLLALALAALTACGGGGGTDEPPPTGSLIEAPVSGVAYRTAESTGCQRAIRDSLPNCDDTTRFTLRSAATIPPGGTSFGALVHR